TPDRAPLEVMTVLSPPRPRRGLPRRRCNISPQIPFSETDYGWRYGESLRREALMRGACWRALLPALFIVGSVQLVLLPASAPVYAATFDVTTTVDYLHSSPLNGNCTSVFVQSCSLRAAIQAANFLGAGPHLIRLKETGTYRLTIPPG